MGINKDNKLLGWISEQECLHVTTQFTYHNQRIGLVKDIMRQEVLSVKADQTIFSLAGKWSGLNLKPTQSLMTTMK